MAGKETVLSVVDNSGIIYAKCINKSSSLNLNEFKLASVITIMPKIINYSKPLRKKKYLGLVVGLKKITMRPNGIWIRFDKNRVLMLNESFKFLGTRIYGPICQEIKKSGYKNSFKKIVSYSKITI